MIEARIMMAGYRAAKTHFSNPLQKLSHLYIFLQLQVEAIGRPSDIVSPHGSFTKTFDLKGTTNPEQELDMMASSQANNADIFHG